MLNSMAEQSLSLKDINAQLAGSNNRSDELKEQRAATSLVEMLSSLSSSSSHAARS